VIPARRNPRHSRGLLTAGRVECRVALKNELPFYWKGQASSHAQSSKQFVQWGQMTNSLDEARQQIRNQEFRSRGGQVAQPTNTTEGPASTLPIKTQGTRPPELREARHTEIPQARLSIEPKPLSAYDDNPVLSEQGAAFIIGVSADLLKKWRSRNQGPNYLQYGPGGPVRYELNALLAFRDYYRVYLSSK